MIEHIEGDCREVLPTLPAKSIQACVTSPPYWALRSYLPHDHPAKAKEIGQERTAQQYIENLVAVFREVSRVLMNDGTLWLNLGDTYAKNSTKAARRAGVKPGELCGIPWRVALALQEDGWFFRSDIIWHKPNPKPESVKNRPTKAHEYLFLFSKRERYHYDIDALREPVTSTGGASFGKQSHSTDGTGAQSRRLKSAAERNHPLGKNKRSVWKIPVRSFPGAHFAVFPPALVRPCILAGCPKNGVVLDCFAGSGTVGDVATELGRDAVLIELNPVYVQMQKGRGEIGNVLGRHEPEATEKPQENPGWLF
jgi:DNA modification methylase